MENAIAIIGLGKLGRSLLNGLESYCTQNKAKVFVSKRSWGTSDTELPNYAIKASNAEALKNAKYIFIAVKPFNMEDVLNELQPFLKQGQQIVSCATGMELSKMKNLLPPGVDLHRAMPNTGAAVKESITCLASHSDNQKDAQEITKMFEGLGVCVQIDENLMDAATVIGACGIAFVMRFIRGMVQGGVQIGLSQEIASKLTYQTVKGAAELLVQNGEHPEAEIDKVTTPKGCTIEGLNEMEHAGFSSALIKGIVSSYKQLED